MALPPNIRVNVRVPFPALVNTQGPVTIAKNNGIYSFGFSVTPFGTVIPPASSYATSFVLGYDTIAQQYIKIPVSALAINEFAGVANNVNFNAIADTQIPIVSPTPNYRIAGFLIQNTGTTASLTVAQFGIFTAAAGGGTALVASGTAMSGMTSNAINTNTNAVSFNSTQAATAVNYTSVFFRITTPQGAAASGNVYVWIQPYP
jgi:hypothetical protein